MKITAKVKTKLKIVRKKAAKFWKNKKNRKIVFFIVGAIIIYLIVRKKRTTTTTPGTGGGIPGGKTDTGTGLDGVNPPNLQSGDLPPYSATPKVAFTLVNNAGVYSDNTPEDFQEGGVTYRNANGRKYRALYWVDEKPWINGDGSIRSFKNITFKNGLFVPVRKEYADVNWAGSFNHENFRTMGWDAWGHGGENPQADMARILFTVMENIVTNGGQNLASGNMIRKNKPSWLDARKMVPQFIFNPSPNRSGKPVCLQAFPVSNDDQLSIKRLSDGGATHLWWENFAQLGGFEPPHNAGINRYGLNVAYNNSSVQFYFADPTIVNNAQGQATRDQARSAADRVGLFPGCIITDEFAEGPYPQLEQSREWYYERLDERIQQSGMSDIQDIGEYGYGSVNFYLKGDGYDFDPMGTYALSLLGPDVVENLILNGGNASGASVKLHQYLKYHSSYRGTAMGAYYAITFMNKHRNPLRILESIIAINGAPYAYKMMFCTTLMQSNGHGADVPTKNSGTILPDGTINYDYPDAPITVMFDDAVLAMLRYDSTYLWEAWGRRNIDLTDENNKFYKSSIGYDAYMAGTRIIAEMRSKLDEVAWDQHMCDYRVAGGVNFNSTTPERRLPKRGTPRYGNRYINEIMKQEIGFGICIPSAKKVFIYQNPYKTPDQTEDVYMKWNGQEYHIGECAGGQMNFFFEP